MPIESSDEDALWLGCTVPKQERIELCAPVIHRFIHFYQLADLLIHRRLAFTSPSAMFDVHDGAPNGAVPASQLKRLLQLLERHGVTDTNEDDPETIRCASLTLQNLFLISCWTWGGESYAMWKAFSDLEWGICIVFDAVKAREWATKHGCYCGRVRYIDQHGTTIEPRPEFLLPACWDKSSFYSPEKEIRFGTRLSPIHLSAVYRMFRDSRVHTPAFGPFSGDFDPYTELQDTAAGNCGIVVAPKAPCWYVQLVRDTVGSFHRQSPVGTPVLKVRQSEAGKALVGDCPDRKRKQA